MEKKSKSHTEGPRSLNETPTQYFNPRNDTYHTRHYLPHWQQNNVPFFVTFRLADSLPKEKLDRWKAEREAWLREHPEPWNESTESEYHDRFSGQVDEWLDQGSGSCLLRHEHNAQVIANSLMHFDGARYQLWAFVVMPNHVHACLQTNHPNTLHAILKSWKGYTARAINKRIGRKGTLWQNDYFDRLIRNESHLFKVIEYIRNNPRKANLRIGEYILWEKT